MTTTDLAPSPGRNPTLAAYRSLHDHLTSGRWPAGSRLPSERSLAEEVGVSRATLRQALQELAAAGLLKASAQRGWFVTSQRISEGPNLLRSFSETAIERGLTPGSQVLGQTVRAATLDEAEVLGLAPAADVLQLDRLRTLDGIPIAFQSTCLSLKLLPGLHSLPLTGRSLFEVLEENFGIVLVRCDFTVQAEGASGEVAQLLRIAPGAPVLVGHELSFDAHERPVSTGPVTYRGDAYRFKASLFRI